MVVRGVDDLRVLSGIIILIRNGLRWCEAPAELGLPKTLYNRWQRWCGMRAFARIMAGTATEATERETVIIDALT